MGGAISLYIDTIDYITGIGNSIQRARPMCVMGCYAHAHSFPGSSFCCATTEATTEAACDKHSFKLSAVGIWNSTPEEIMSCRSDRGFKIRLRQLNPNILPHPPYIYMSPPTSSHLKLLNSSPTTLTPPWKTVRIAKS